MKINIGIIIFLIAGLSRIVSRAFPKQAIHISNEKIGKIITVCFCCKATDDWEKTVVRFMQSAQWQSGLRFGVLIHCDSIEDTHIEASHLRKIVDVHHTIVKNRHASCRKMIKRFVNGLESYVVISDHRLEPVYGWDTCLYKMIKRSKNSLVTCPSSQYKVGFPTLRRMDGKTFRGASKEMIIHTDPARLTISSVCACEEFMVASPSVLVSWRLSNTLLSSMTSEIPTVQILEGSNYERDYVFREVQLPYYNENGVGLTKNATVEELHYKYGSTAAARIAIKLYNVQVS